jgi:hypothetical protein
MPWRCLRSPLLTRVRPCGVLALSHALQRPSSKTRAATRRGSARPRALIYVKARGRRLRDDFHSTGPPGAMPPKWCLSSPTDGGPRRSSLAGPDVVFEGLLMGSVFQKLGGFGTAHDCVDSMKRSRTLPQAWELSANEAWVSSDEYRQFAPARTTSRLQWPGLRVAAIWRLDRL